MANSNGFIFLGFNRLKWELRDINGHKTLAYEETRISYLRLMTPDATNNRCHSTYSHKVL